MKIKNILVIGIAALGLTSCDDFLTIYPTDRTIGPDFWQSKDDVQQMTTGCYKAMISGNIMERAIMWGAFRSDEVIKNGDDDNIDLDNISAVNLLPTQGICSWSQFYNVINCCNVVLNHAPGVMDIDPDYTVGDNQVVRGQMLALRSLCYFYLVRAFRDVPYSGEAFESDNQTLIFPQSAPGEVLQHCIDDLKEAEGIIMKSGAYGENDWRNVGFITRDAVDAILADIYLWRAAMTHDRADYEQAVIYADKVIEAKDTYYKKYNSDRVTTQDPNDVYHLLSGALSRTSIFVTGNSRESILEWQYDGVNNANTTLADYYDYQKSKRDKPKLKASKIFRTPDAGADNAQSEFLYLTENDLRYWNNVYEAGGSSNNAGYAIRKMADRTQDLFTRETRERSKPSRQYDDYEHYQRNWIVYRLTDVMLMKAEALVELAADDNDAEYLERAFHIVQQVNKRSLVTSASDSLLIENYRTKDRMELLVLAERERELCFEGKRWFDLLRFNYRHTDGVDINKRMSDEDYVAPALYPTMLSFIVRKYEGSGDAVRFKMKTEPYLYWPIAESETKVNNLLVQNPVYKTEDTTQKNY